MKNNLKEVEESGNLLDNFDWEETSEFFQVEPKEKSVVSEVDSVVEELKDTSKTDKEVEIETPKDDTSFQFGADEETASKEEISFSFKAVYDKLKETGVMSVDLEEDEEDIDEDRFLELQEAEIDNRVDETFKGFFEELPEEGVKFLKFVKEGGNAKDFFELLKNANTRIDITTEKGQEAFLRQYHKSIEDMDDEDIDDVIERYKEKGNLEKYAQKYHTKEKEKEEKELANMKVVNEARKKEAEKQHEVLVNDLKSIITDKAEIKGWTLSKTDKKDLHSFLTRPSVKVGNNKYKTGFQDALQKAFADKEKLILLGKILQSDFNLESLEKSIETKVTKKTKEELNKKETTPKRGGGNDKTSKGLSDYFN